MKKYILIFLICLFIPFSVNATSVVMDMDSKRVLSGSAENETKLIASTTKILTAMVVINNTDIKNIVTVDENVLKKYHKSKEWLIKKLEENNLTLKTTLYAFYKGNTMYVVRK